MNSKEALDLIENCLLRPTPSKAGQREPTPAPLPPAIEAGLSDLIAGLMSDDTNTRLTLIANLGEIGLPEVLDLVMIRLGREMRRAKPALRQRISEVLFMLQVQALRLRAPGASVPVLLVMLECPDPVARQEAAGRLGELKQDAKAAVPALTALLKDADGPVQLAAALLRIEGRLPPRENTSAITSAAGEQISVPDQGHRRRPEPLQR